MEKWYRILLPKGVFAIKTIDGKVVKTASMGKWMKGKVIWQVENWVLSNNGTIEEMNGEFNESSN